MPGAVAVGGDLTLGVDERLFQVATRGSAGAQADGNDALAHVSGTDGAVHVVAGAGVNGAVGRQAEAFHQLGAHRSNGRVRWPNLGEFGYQGGVDGVDDLLRPGPRRRMPERHTRGIAGLHRGDAAGQMPVDVIVHQEQRGRFSVRFGFVAFHVEDLRRRVAGALTVADRLDHGLESADPGGQ